MRPHLRPRLAAALLALAAASCSEGNNANTNPARDASQEAPGDTATQDLGTDTAPPGDLPPGEDAARDATPDHAADAPGDVHSDMPSDAPSDVAPDAPSDLGVDASVDVPGDLPADAPHDVAEDLPRDTGPAPCDSDTRCEGDPAGPVCDTTTGRCVACTPTRDVCPLGQRCLEGSNTCAPGCRDDASCASDGGTATRCDPVTHACVRCLVDTHCPAGQRCASNACVEGCVTETNCPTGASCCASRCVDTATSADHCGACGAACVTPHGTARCAAGACGVGACTEPWADCNGAASDGCEADTRTDVAHCGRCGASASVPHATATCAGGAPAVGACDAGFADCDGAAANGCETSTSANVEACGACGVRCVAGQRCEGGSCVTDCRRSGTVPCGSGTACDYTDGQCRATGARCALTGEFTECGAQRCGPGAVCNPRTMACVSGLSCRGVSCEEGTGRCWGSDCPCERPAAACTTLAPSSVPSSFLSGAFGFDIDDACNLYTATMLSGPDYVRRVDPSGRVTTWTSVANLNMGEVAVQRRINVGPGGLAVNVAFTYICCASCGCASTPPQGVGHVQTDGTLPVVVPATITTGTGPFGIGHLDTGPYGLSVSALGEFFVGNVRANGDFYRYDTDTRTITSVATLPARITATTSFDLDTMLVALQGGELYLVERSPGGAARRLGTLGADVQSVRRDAFTGRFYASLRGGRIVSFLPDATGVTTETTVARGSRVAISPDGWLYILLEEGGPVSRVALPTAR